ncbi:MAG: PAS domain S-box protein [Pseudonocardiaceae bacterium]
MPPRGLPIGRGPIGRRPVPILLVAAVAFLGVSVLRASVDGGDAVLILDVLPIALLAVRFGRWVGLAAAVFALLQFAVWAAWQSGVEITPLAYVTRGVVFVLVGYGMGCYAERLRAAVNMAYASEDRYRALLEYAPEAIVVLDAHDGSFRQVNHRALTLFGLPREQLKRFGPDALSPPRQPDGRPSDEAIREKIAQAVEGRRPVFEWTYRTGDGADLPCEVRLVRLPDPERERVLVRGSITELSERARSTPRAPSEG